MKLSLFQYAILWHPTEKEIKETGAKTILITGPETTLAGSTEQVRMQAAMSIPSEYRDKLDQVEIGVRPF